MKYYVIVVNKTTGTVVALVPCISADKQSFVYSDYRAEYYNTEYIVSTYTID